MSAQKPGCSEVDKQGRKDADGKGLGMGSVRSEQRSSAGEMEEYAWLACWQAQAAHQLVFSASCLLFRAIVKSACEHGMQTGLSTVKYAREHLARVVGVTYLVMGA